MMRVIIPCLKEGKADYLQLTYSTALHKYYGRVKDKFAHTTWRLIELKAQTQSEAVEEAMKIHVP